MLKMKLENDYKTAPNAALLDLIRVTVAVLWLQLAFSANCLVLVKEEKRGQK